MSRQTGIAVSNNFVGGLITEAPFLGFPPNACTETLDCIHNITGSVERRLGWDFEINHSTKQISRIDDVVCKYLWKDVAGDGRISLLVIQVGPLLYFYDASTTDPLSSRPLSAGVSLHQFAVTYGDPPVTVSNDDIATLECQFAVGNGKLFGVHPYCEPFAIEYNQDDKTFTVTKITIQIRDFELQDDGYDIDERPSGGLTGIGAAHRYNLLNQGWTNNILASWDAARNDMPSNADVMGYFKGTTGKFDTSTINDQTPFVGNTPAPNGHFVLSAFNKDRNSVSGLNLPVDSSGKQRPSTIAFYAGRAFYSGVNYTGLNANIYFSQIIESEDQYGKCFQRNDPTSDKLFDLLPNDGGVIVVQEAGTIIKLASVPGALLVFASNGIWSIQGSTGLGFTANDYSVTKISSVPALTATSFVDLQGALIWWGLDSIYRIDGSQQGFQVTSVTNTTIKSFYETIPPSEKRNARGEYNPTSNILQWLFKSTESSSLDESYEFDRILNLNTLTGSFYIWTIPDTIYKIHGITILENRGGIVELENVTDNSLVNITDNSSNVIQVWDIEDSIVVPNFKYIMSYKDSLVYFTFAETRQDTYTDWHEAALDLPYTSTFTTGYAADGKAILNFERMYANFFANSGSKFFVKAKWDFSNSGDSGRWSNDQVIDFSSVNHFDIASKRLKIRGTGKIVQMNITSFENNKFNIKGWSSIVNSNSTV